MSQTLLRFLLADDPGAGTEVKLTLHLEANGELDINLVDLSIQESVQQLNPTGKVRAEQQVHLPGSTTSRDRFLWLFRLQRDNAPDLGCVCGRSPHTHPKSGIFPAKSGRAISL
jgi:hypothetical protein